MANPCNMPDTVPDDTRRALGDRASRIGELVSRRYFANKPGAKIYAQVSRRDLAMLCATAAYLVEHDACTILRDVLAFFREFDGAATFNEINHDAVTRAQAYLRAHGLRTNLNQE